MIFDTLLNKLKRRFLSSKGQGNILQWVDSLSLGINLVTEQQTVLAAYYGLRLTPSQQDVIDRWKLEDKTNYTESVYKDLVLGAGRRSGKMLLESIIAVYEFERLCRCVAPQSLYGLDSCIGLDIIWFVNSHNVLRNSKEYVTRLIKSSDYLSLLFKQGELIVTEKGIMYPTKHLSIRFCNYDEFLPARLNPVLTILDETAYQPTHKVLNLIENIEAMSFLVKDKAKLVIASSAFSGVDILEYYRKREVSLPGRLNFDLATWDLYPVMHKDNPVVQSAYDSNEAQAKLMFEGVKQ